MDDNEIVPRLDSMSFYLPNRKSKIINDTSELAIYQSKIKEIPIKLAYQLKQSFDDGWNVYNSLNELNRLGIPDSLWKITTLNYKYELCPSYPAICAVPASIDDDILKGSANFRSKGRFPTLCWRNSNNKCTISRCSQPMVGIGSNRSTHDEMLVDHINRSGGSYAKDKIANNYKITGDLRNQPGKPLIIYDARPLLNATANQAAGKGTENEKNYENCSVIFLDIANIHAIRKSLDMLEDACTDEAHWLKNLDQSMWFSHNVRILRAAVRIVHSVAFEDRSVIIHCSDGWDRTAQLTSMSMILLDPYYRTLRGFIILIEKEWVSFGHKFGDRLGWTGKYGYKDEEKSSIFQQFLECIYQLLCQSPNIFEFNEYLLLFLMENAHSGWYGNFLFNCEKERKENQSTMISIWTPILQSSKLYINQSYQPTNGVFIPIATKHRLVVWNRWYLRWQERVWLVSYLSNMQDDEMNENDDMNNYNYNGNLIQWADDKTAKGCRRCAKTFSFIRRKHHCRYLKFFLFAN